ncbi:MAG: DUF4317 domain-containing protein [Lachnospiraceae bacterium]|jgi:hypothetical protein
MNKKEIAEIRRTFQKNKHAVDTVAGCYVDNEKQLHFQESRNFLMLPEDMQRKYEEIFRKSLSGALGKNLHSLEYTAEQEIEGEGQKMLLALRESGLKDEELLGKFFQKAADSYDCGENYYIVLIHGNYDVPGRGTDDLEIEDASTEVYEYILCSICPVDLSAPGLHYNAAQNVIEEREQDWWVELPVNAFLYPAFTDRSADIHGLLYYAKKPEALHTEFLDGCIGGPSPMSYKTQKETFQDVLTGTLGDDCQMDVVTSVQEELSDLVEKHKDEPDPVMITRPDLRRILESSGADDRHMEQFDHVYSEVAGEKTAFMANTLAPKKVNIKTADIRVTVPPDQVGRIETRMVDGKKCLVIPFDGNVEINGIPAVVGEAFRLGGSGQDDENSENSAEESGGRDDGSPDGGSGDRGSGGTENGGGQEEFVDLKNLE